MARIKTRKEISSDSHTLSILQTEKKDIKLKKIVEPVINELTNEFELTDEYKTMMDEMLEKEEKGELEYYSEAEFRELTKRK